jgi:hypothetical protein
VKYNVLKTGKEKFQSKLTRLAEHKFSDMLNAASPETLDNILCTRTTTEPDRKIGRGILLNTGGRMQKFVPNFTGHKDDTDTQNCPLVVVRTHNNAKEAECA